MTKEQLKSFRHKNIRIIKLQQTIETIKARAEIQASVLSHTPKGTNENECKILKSITQLEDIQKKLANEIADFADEMQNVYDCIRSIVDIKVRSIFEMRYMQGETFETIAYEMNMSWRHVHRLHSQGLQEVEGWTIEK